MRKSSSRLGTEERARKRALKNERVRNETRCDRESKSAGRERKKKQSERVKRESQKFFFSSFFPRVCHSLFNPRLLLLFPFPRSRFLDLALAGRRVARSFTLFFTLTKRDRLKKSALSTFPREHTSHRRRRPPSTDARRLCLSVCSTPLRPAFLPSPSAFGAPRVCRAPFPKRQTEFRRALVPSLSERFD